MNIYTDVYRHATAADFKQKHTSEYFCTGTFRYDLGEIKGFELFTQFAFRLTREVVKKHMAIFWGWDFQKNGRPHFHFVLATLLEEPVFISRQSIKDVWQYGNMNVRIYDQNRGGEFYIAKHRHFDQNVLCPRTAPCSRKKCKVAPGPWPTPASIWE